MPSLFDHQIKPGELPLVRQPAFFVSHAQVRDRVYSGPSLDRVHGDLVFASDLGLVRIHGNVKANGHLLAGRGTGLEIRGDVSINASASIGLGLAVVGQIDVRGDLVTGWRIFSTGRCGVHGILWSADDVVARGGLWAERGLCSFGTVETPGSLGSSGYIAVRHNLECEGSVRSGRVIEVHGEVSVLGDLRCRGICRIAGNANIGGCFTSTGRVQARRDLECAGDISVDGDMEVAWSIRTRQGVAVSGHLASGRCIKAGTNIAARTIAAKDRIFAGLLDDRPLRTGEGYILGALTDGRIVTGKHVPGTGFQRKAA